MNRKKNIAFSLLQLFADGDGAGEGAIGSASAENNADNSGQPATDTGAESSEQTIDKKQTFQDLINGDYKDEYEKHFESQLSRRIKSRDARIKEAEEYRGKIAPVLDKLAAKYGLSDVNDIDTLIAEVEKDNSYYQEYAMKHGVSVEQAKELIEAEKIRQAEAVRLQQEAERQEFDSKYQDWMRQSEIVKQKFPSFDFVTESENESFRRLLNAGTDVETAYTVIHRDEIMSGALAYGYERSKQEIADSRTMRNARPIENGVSSQQSAGIKDDINKLSPEDRKKINAAVHRGERVTPENFRQFL